MPSDNVIRFNSKSVEYGWLSNFHEASMQIHGLEWPTVEHFFQAQKFISLEYGGLIRMAPTAAGAKKMGRSRDYAIRNDWNTHRVVVMKTAIDAKFLQNADLRELLILTHPLKLAESSRFDRFWAVGANDVGMNMLGTIIMELRSRLIEGAETEDR